MLTFYGRAFCFNINNKVLIMARRRITSDTAFDTSKIAGKRLRTTVEVLRENGEDPTLNLIRIANKAEQKKDLTTAASIWKELKSYIDAKRKAVNPIDDAGKLEKIATLKQLQEMKAAILAGTIEAIDDSTVQDAETITNADDLI